MRSTADCPLKARYGRSRIRVGFGDRSEIKGPWGPRGPQGLPMTALSFGKEIPYMHDMNDRPRVLA
eukprot:3836444-Prymnesium_polylepis.1